MGICMKDLSKKMTDMDMEDGLITISAISKETTGKMERELVLNGFLITNDHHS